MAFSHFSLPASLLAYLSLVTSVKATAAPIAAKWSSRSFGPDGPWPAVEVVVGSEQTIALYPGREFGSFLLTTEYCDYNSSLCYATEAGVYNPDQSYLQDSGSSGEIQWAPSSSFMTGLPVQGGEAKSWMDYVDLQTGAGAIPNVSIALIGEAFATYPGGGWFPLSVGCLGIGAPRTVNQSFTTGGAPINASLIPGYLREDNEIPSNSFGMHIGSAEPQMDGSLYFGGYDQDRVIGEIITSQGDYNGKDLSLQDISIQVLNGSSPWTFGESKTGLLASGNSSIGSDGINVRVDGCSPYLSLPTSTCNAIAAQLPVTFNSALGLYIWNTNDTKFEQIVGSPSALEFTFLAGSNTNTVSIYVPFRHLNLTLDAPLVDTPQQYFPCFTGNEGGPYTLGRAFLQDAFVGANWEQNTWWLAQAPGPNVPSGNVVQIASGDTSIKSGTNDWKQSWSGSWKALTAQDVNGSSSANASTATPSSQANSAKSGLSTGAKAGIGAGVGVAGLAIIGALGFFCLYRPNRSKDSPSDSNGVPYDGTAAQVSQHGYYEPVKNPTSPGMAQATLWPQQQQIYNQGQQMYSQGYYAPQGYGQEGWPQHYSVELPQSSPPQELPVPELNRHEAPQQEPTNRTEQ